MELLSNEAVMLSIIIVLLSLATAVGIFYGRSRRLQSLQSRNDYLATIIDSANEGIYVTDRERRFLMWNQAAAGIAGYARDDIVGKLCYDNILCHTDEEGRELCFSRCPLQGAIEQGASRGPEVIYLRRRDGRRVPVSVKTAPLRDVQGRIIGGVEIFEDVSERLEREKLLRERKDKLEAVLDGINDGILFLDSDGAIRGVNRSCSRMLDIDGDIVGSRLNDLDRQLPLWRALALTEKDWPLPMDRGGSLSCAWRGTSHRCWTGASAHDGGQNRPACMNCGVFQSGRAFLERPRELPWGGHTLSVASSFPDGGGEIILFRDVSAEKLDAALNVAGAAAHELRQPLQVLLMIADFVKRSEPQDVTIREQMGAVVESCRRMDAIIRQMTEITTYRTKDYVDGTTILDIKNSADRANS